MKIDVLDKGYVRLVDSMGDDLSIVRSARVSHDADWRVGIEDGSDERLLKYLWKHKHMTPFESVTFTFEVKAPIFIVRQWHRHRTQSYNEVSARYTELPVEFYVPNAEVIGRQSKSHKQARIVDEVMTFDEVAARQDQVLRYTFMCQQAFLEYEELLQAGWPRELARMVLPLSTYTRMFTTVNLRNLLAFLTLRADSHAQWEIQQYAQALISIASTICPVAMEAWSEDQG